MIALYFYIIFILILYHYLGFPLLTFMLSWLKRKPINRKEIYPDLSLIIAAYNEEKVIEEKIRNCVALDYPEERLEVIIVSDGSTDHTPQLVEKYRKPNLKGLFEPPRRGKTAALNRAVQQAKGEIIVFSDANSMYDPQALKMLVRNFNDPAVGGTCGRKSILKNLQRESSRGDSLFWDFESYLKKKQSITGSISTGDGEIFAIRKNLYSKIPETIINDDTAITFNIINAGFRVVYEPEAITWEEASTVIEDDFNVKARMVSGGYQTLKFYAHMLFPPRSYFAFQFLSHKMLRWGMPFLLINLFISSLLMGYGIYIVLWWAQAAFYLTAILGYSFRKSNINMKVLYFPFYYCAMNIAAGVGFFYFLRRDSLTNIWKKAAR
jgi:poly-beta-1,6-N-acetyl-D-glucosamine synthase